MPPDQAEFPNLLIVIGASAGGLDPITTIIERFPEHLQATVIVATHRDPRVEENLLARILARNTRVSVREPIEGEKLCCTTLYIGKPKESVQVEGRDFHIDHVAGHPESMKRIDDLFHSAADSAGENAVGVILSGSLWDGVAGLAAIDEAGGRCIVQNPLDASFQDMPRHALESVDVDFVGTAEEIADRLVGLAEGRTCR